MKAEELPERIGHYRLLGKLGEGGMGVVHVATDERLGRRVALKFLKADVLDPRAHERLIREARVVAGISHPLICQVFELGEWDGRPFIVMELVEGEPLASRLSRGPLPAGEALSLAASVADGLSALHRQGIVHRDLKPSNVFLTTGGIKILDFGLARPFEVPDGQTVAAVTLAGVIVGTPQYAAPEQLLGKTVDVRADLFSAGVILFEMLAGRPPFSGDTVAAVIHATLYDAPPVLTGSPAIAALDRVLHRALSKHPDERYQSADALAADLRALTADLDDSGVVMAQTILRLAVLPFRILTPHPDIDYLSVSLADALAASLSGRESLVVRSTLTSARFANAIPDPARLASELAVDAVVTGSIIQRRDRLQVTVELVSVPQGDVKWTQTTDAAVGDVAELYAQLSLRVAESFALTEPDRTHARSARPASPKAFDLYLRGMQLRMETSSWRQARAFFEQCLEIDPSFAPAWAERGRLDRVIGKYQETPQLARAEAALQRAIELDPDNAAAEHYFAQLEIDLGRIESALERLLARARLGRAEPQIHAALVHACRYAGLLDASLAADARARRLDPTVSTSVLHTYYMRGDYQRALDESHRTSDPFEARVLAALGREAEAIAAARREEERFEGVPALRSFSAGLRAALEGRQSDAHTALKPLRDQSFSDGEGLFYVAEIEARIGAIEDVYATLELSVQAGFVCRAAFENAPALAPARRDPRWTRLIERVVDRQQSLAGRYVAAGGRALLG